MNFDPGNQGFNLCLLFGLYGAPGRHGGKVRRTQLKIKRAGSGRQQQKCGGDDETSEACR